MKLKPQYIDRDALLALATDPSRTPFDYIVVGSGAGGGPLASRLAEGGRRVLVIEAGVDPASAAGGGNDAPSRPANDIGNMRDVYAVPAYHAAATEDPLMSWEFSVRHYDDKVRQSKDSKYCAARDPSPKGQQGKGGIQYPRASALGGCTAHHAMVFIRPNDLDWDRIAAVTGDDSWRSENMQGYFAKLENCLYYVVYKKFLGRILGGLLWGIQWIATRINPRRQLDPGGHGFAGWQPTSFIDPLVVAGIARRDRAFLGVLRDVVWSALSNKNERSLIKRAIANLQIIQFLDPNVRSQDHPSRTHLSLISIGTDGVRRSGVRERLLAVAGNHPDRLVLMTGVHATRVLFEREVGKPTPRAIGVEVALGEHLYQASKMKASTTSPKTMQYFARREVVLSGGSFNTPQLLMLSGIGDAVHLRSHGIRGLRDRAGEVVAPTVHLPGVGANLQDRYEVSVISETNEEFTTLKGVSFVPGDEKDPARLQWLRDGTGLYSTNGGALAMMLSSKNNANPNPAKQPDLFIFGFPAAFRGYYWGWSKELLRRIKGAPSEQRNLWTWVILKAYTHNNHGTIRLRSGDPFCPPDINFRSFSEGPQEYGQDVEALCEAVARVRGINRCIKSFTHEIQPDSTLAPDDSVALADWVQREAWGHHACGTCKIGADCWQADVTLLEDKCAVLDSKFQVHGVRGLRVVDASVFPAIPGYFIVAPVFMVSEKAADTLLTDSREYPSALEQAEAAAIHTRRKAINGNLQADEPAPTKLPGDTVGLALSGGGIRSATFCLGVLQALAACKKLRQVDILSSVSGGGYIGGFLGRLYTRMTDVDVKDKVGRVEAVLTTPRSPELWWLRKHADYIGGAGRTDLETNLAIFARNLVFVHVCLGALLLGLLGLLRWLPDVYFPGYAPAWTMVGITASFWWWLPLAVLFVDVVPLAIGYWLAPNANSRRPYPSIPLILWAALLVSAIAALDLPGAVVWSGIAIAVLLLAWLVQEIAHWGVAQNDASIPEGPQGGGPGNPPSELSSIPLSTLVRNRLTRALGTAILALAVTVLWVVLDSLARHAAMHDMIPVMGWAMLGLAPVLPLLRAAAIALVRNASRESSAQAKEWKFTVIVGGLAFVSAAVLLFALDVLAHTAFNSSPLLGAWVVVTALAGSVIVGRALPFLNLSSLQQSYAHKLVRTFLGASSNARVHPGGSDAPVPVAIPNADDDVLFDEYHPEQNGGPLHLINVCVNDTVDRLSGRQLQQDNGLPMCVGPMGVSVGRRYHAMWEPDKNGKTANAITACPLPVAPDPNAFHVLARRDRRPVEVERLRLGQWMSISGAAFTTGSGRGTNLARSLLLGLLNVRLGYWWDSGINAGNRPGRYPSGAWRWLKSLPAAIFRLQATLLNEWRGYFAGPSARLWYLSDGGHFDNTGLYELIRRRLPFIIAIDGARDQRYELGDLAILIRQARLDFGAEWAWLDPTGPRKKGEKDWTAFDAAQPSTPVPIWIRSLIEPNAVGSLAELKRDGPYCAALARISYNDDPAKVSWLLLLKANLAPNTPVDVRNYAMTHPAFPNQSTANQFFDDDQWESYRNLGECAGRSVFR